MIQKYYTAIINAYLIRYERVSEIICNWSLYYFSTLWNRVAMQVLISYQIYNMLVSNFSIIIWFKFIKFYKIGVKFGWNICMLYTKNLRIIFYFSKKLLYLPEYSCYSYPNVHRYFKKAHIIIYYSYSLFLAFYDTVWL